VTAAKAREARQKKQIKKLEGDLSEANLAIKALKNQIDSMATSRAQNEENTP
jgi:hypothetical protein